MKALAHNAPAAIISIMRLYTSSFLYSLPSLSLSLLSRLQKQKTQFLETPPENHTLLSNRKE